jgi:hypothetical protein
MSNRPEVTFILPTRNRVQWIVRAIQSCLDLECKEFGVRVLVIDGQSTDGAFEAVQEKLAGDVRVLLRRQTREGRFTAACQEGVDAVQTEYAALMFDDDILLPNYGLLAKKMIHDGSSFGFGFGALGAVAGRLNPSPAKGVWWLEPDQLLQAYLGFRGKLGHHGYPQSPLCALAKAALWKEWSVEIDKFCRENPLRVRCMLEKSAGPDFLIYLLAASRGDRPIPALNGVVAQFSEHKGTLTAELSGAELPTGYWLSYRWLLEEVLRQKRPQWAASVHAYLLKKLRSLHMFWQNQAPDLFAPERNSLSLVQAEIPAFYRWQGILRSRLPRLFRMAEWDSARYEEFPP